MMFRFLHAADIHLDSPLRGLSRYDGAPLERLRSATRGALENLVRVALEERVAFVVIAGDLYDGSWKDFNTGLFLVQQLGRLTEAGIDVVLLHGNHDAESQLTRSLPLPERVHVLPARRAATVRLERCGVALHGQSFRDPRTTENLVPGYPAPEPGALNIGVLHTALEGDAQHASYAPCTLTELVNKGYDYWALGHVHAAKVLHRDPWVVFPGNLQGRHARETGPKGAMLVTVDGGAVIDVEAVHVDVLRWARVEVDAAGAAAMGALEDRVREALAGALRDEAEGRPLAARVVLRGACAIHSEIVVREEQLRADLRAIAAGLGADLAWIEKIVVETRPEATGAPAGAEIEVPGDLLSALRGGPGDPELQAALREELAGLLARLPAEVAAELDAGPLAGLAEGRVEAVLRDALPLALARLENGEG